MKFLRYFFFAFLSLLLMGVSVPITAFAQTTAQRLSGRILLQVQANGEAWYVDPATKSRYFLGDAETTLTVLQSKARTIPHAILTSYLKNHFPLSLAGRVVADSDTNVTYYVIPVKRKAVPLSTKDDAKTIVQKYHLGVTNATLAHIAMATNAPSTNTTLATTTSGAEGQPTDPLEKQAFDLVNQHRVAKGLPALLWNDTIANIARQHSANMANGTVAFGHLGFSDRMAAIRKTITEYSGAENVAYNDYSDAAQKAFDSWLSSPGHLANMENKLYSLTGIGMVKTSDGKYYFTQIFVGTTCPWTTTK